MENRILDDFEAYRNFKELAKQQLQNILDKLALDEATIILKTKGEIPRQGKVKYSADGEYFVVQLSDRVFEFNTGHVVDIELKDGKFKIELNK